MLKDLLYLKIVNNLNLFEIQRRFKRTLLHADSLDAVLYVYCTTYIYSIQYNYTVYVIVYMYTIIQYSSLFLFFLVIHVDIDVFSTDIVLYETRYTQRCNDFRNKIFYRT